MESEQIETGKQQTNEQKNPESVLLGEVSNSNVRILADWTGLRQKRQWSEVRGGAGTDRVPSRQERQDLPVDATADRPQKHHRQVVASHAQELHCAADNGPCA